MSSVPVPADPGWDEDLAWLDRDPVTAADWEAWLDHLCELDDPFDDPEEYWDPEACAPAPVTDEHGHAVGHGCTRSEPKSRRKQEPRAQQPRWHVDQLPNGTFRWITPTGRTYTAEPTRYPV